jgi:hypothetical protein
VALRDGPLPAVRREGRASHVTNSGVHGRGPRPGGVPVSVVGDALLVAIGPARSNSHEKETGNGRT